MTQRLAVAAFPIIILNMSFITGLSAGFWRDPVGYRAPALFAPFSDYMLTHRISSECRLARGVLRPLLLLRAFPSRTIASPGLPWFMMGRTGTGHSLLQPFDLKDIHTFW